MLWFVRAAYASAPVFSAFSPDVAEKARLAWTAAEACTGWEAPHHEQVEVRQGYVPGGFVGGAWIDGDGLYRVQLGLDNVDRALVHEIAHAWATAGPSALTEGRADLLADCIVTRAPSVAPLDPDPGTSLQQMPDLRRWSASRRDGVDLDTSRSDAYLGAARLMRAVAEVVDRRSLWPTSGLLRWRDFDDLLRNAGAPGTMVLAMLAGGERTQREALSDADGDGEPWLAEVLGGTDPNRWDSDGDGWWDGAAPPSISAVPLPPDGTPVCAGFSGRPGAMVQILASGVLRSGVPPEVSAFEGSYNLEGDLSLGVTLSGRGPLLMRLSATPRAAGGLWAMVGGNGLQIDGSCQSNPRHTVWWSGDARTPRAAVWDVGLRDEFLGVVDIYLGRAEALLGPSPTRLVVQLGGEGTEVRPDGVVQLSDGELAWARAAGRPDALAAVAVAVHRVFSAKHVERAAEGAEALTRAILDNPPDLTFVSVDLQQAERRAKTATGCDQGWTGALAGRCEPRAAAEDATASPDVARPPRRGRRSRSENGLP
jgi:hypothetical protein